MEKKYFDLHCHPFKEYFPEPKEIISNALSSYLTKIFLVGTDISNSVEAINLAKEFDNVYAIIGIHPNDSWNEKDLISLEELVANNPNVLGIGEVGLDYHYDDSPEKEKQEMFFQKQIDLAIKYNKVLIVHSRDSVEDTFAILQKNYLKYPELKIVLHSYSYGPKWIEKFLSLNCYFSYSGIVTFKNAKEMQEAALITPIENILYETDTPYLAPVPHRGKTNLPEYAIHVCDFIAKIKGIEEKEFATTILGNLNKLFNFKN
ncbi:MAG: TatD family hydrolase [Metamycoplasmataceae bacterium]